MEYREWDLNNKEQWEEKEKCGLGKQTVGGDDFIIEDRHQERWSVVTKGVKKHRRKERAKILLAGVSESFFHLMQHKPSLMLLLKRFFKD